MIFSEITVHHQSKMEIISLSILKRLQLQICTYKSPISCIFENGQIYVQTFKIMPNVSFAHIYTLFQIQIRHKYVQTFLCHQITRFAHIKTLFHSFFKMRLGNKMCRCISHNMYQFCTIQNPISFSVSLSPLHVSKFQSNITQFKFHLSQF